MSSKFTNEIKYPFYVRTNHYLKCLKLQCGSSEAKIKGNGSGGRKMERTVFEHQEKIIKRKKNKRKIYTNKNSLDNSNLKFRRPQKLNKT